MTQPMQVSPVRLITIPVSHYCEKIRWALIRSQIPFVEDRHMPPFHQFSTNRVGGKSVPVLVTDTQVLTDSADILKYIDEISPPALKLYPVDAIERQQVEDLVRTFDLMLATAVRQWAYFHIINDRSIMQPLFCQGTPWYERVLFPIVFKKIPAKVQEGYNINPASAAIAHQTITDIFETVNKLLADGRNYLVGDRFSAADLAFATLAAPIVSPIGYSIKLPELSDLPIPMATGISEFRSTPAGKFIIRLYKEGVRGESIN
jgi:glutathione S-transferase